MMRKNSLLGLFALLFLLTCKPLPVVDETGGSGGSGEKPEDLLKKYIVAYYPFDDGTAKCTSEVSADGVLLGSPNFITDTPSGNGKALFLNGIKEQCVNIPYNLFKGLKYFTISVWVKDFSTGSVVSGIYASDYNNNDYQYFPRLYFLADGKISFVTSDYYRIENSPSFTYSYTAIQSSAWHHIAVVCSEGNLSLYVDGVYADNLKSSWSDPGDARPKVQIGGNGTGRFPVFFSGKVDNVAIYSSALQGDIVKYIFDNKL